MSWGQDKPQVAIKYIIRRVPEWVWVSLQPDQKKLHTRPCLGHKTGHKSVLTIPNKKEARKVTNQRSMLFIVRFGMC